MYFSFLFSLNMAVNPLHGETWMSLPDIHFQKGPVPNTELPAMPTASEKGTEVCGASKTCIKQPSVVGHPGTICISSSRWRNGVTISYGLSALSNVSRVYTQLGHFGWPGS